MAYYMNTFYNVTRDARNFHNKAICMRGTNGALITGQRLQRQHIFTGEFGCANQLMFRWCHACIASDHGNSEHLLHHCELYSSKSYKMGMY